MCTRHGVTHETAGLKELSVPQKEGGGGTEEDV